MRVVPVGACSHKVLSDMSHAQSEMKRPKLEIFRIIEETFSIFLRNFFALSLLSIVPMLIITPLIVGAFFVTLASVAVAPSSLVVAIAVVAAVALFLTVSNMTIGLVVCAVHDARRGRPITPRAYVSIVFNRLGPITLLTILSTVILLLATMVLVLPGLYLFACWIAFIPLIVLENAGNGALGRSYLLTRDYRYRWPIVGGCLLIALGAGALAGLANLINMAIPESWPDILLLPASLALSLLPLALTYGLQGVFVAVTYERLQAIEAGIKQTRRQVSDVAEDGARGEIPWGRPGY
jgi:hypothetical protein